MSFQEKLLDCIDCEKNFTFTVEEQDFHASQGFINEPLRCPSCRQARKTEPNVKESESSSYSYKPQRQMFAVTCAQCGKNTQVPFEPRHDKPVYCSDCYNTVRMSR